MLDKLRYILLLSIIGLISGCSEPGSSVNDPAQQSMLGSKEMAVRNLDIAQVERGEAVYVANCVACHGKNGEATPDWRKTGEDGKYPPPPLNGTAHTWHHSTEVLKKTILEGTPPEFGSMPAWEGKLTEQQVDDVIVWITSLWPDEVYDVWYKNFENPQ
jgi:mono/diheme cytochrome c family protein